MVDLDKRYQNLEKSYKCGKCGTEVKPSMHCGHPMHLEDLSAGREWVCWMGSSCGHKEYDACCDAATIPVYETINP